MAFEMGLKRKTGRALQGGDATNRAAARFREGRPEQPHMKQAGSWLAIRLKQEAETRFLN